MFGAACVLVMFGCDILIRPFWALYRVLARPPVCVDFLNAVEDDRVFLSKCDGRGPEEARPADDAHYRGVIRARSRLGQYLLPNRVIAWVDGARARLGRGRAETIRAARLDGQGLPCSRAMNCAPRG